MEVNQLNQVDLELVRSVFSDPRVTHTVEHGYVGPPGLAAYYVDKDGQTAGLLFCCPGDGVVSSIAFKTVGGGGVWSWDGNREKPTTKPSILCNKEKGGCGWHGWLTAGRFHL